MRFLPEHTISILCLQSFPEQTWFEILFLEIFAFRHACCHGIPTSQPYCMFSSISIGEYILRGIYIIDFIDFSPEVPSIRRLFQPVDYISSNSQINKVLTQHHLFVMPSSLKTCSLIQSFSFLPFFSIPSAGDRIIVCNDIVINWKLRILVSQHINTKIKIRD